jgi:hypothetical protein
LLTVVGLSHAEDVANRATRRVSDDDQSVSEATVADDPALAVVPAGVVHLDGRSSKDDQSIFEVEPALSQCLLSLGWVEGQSHEDIVSTKTTRSKAAAEGRVVRRLTFELRGPRRCGAWPARRMMT